MKLLYCPDCGDLFRLWIAPQARSCACGKTCGRYVDGLKAAHNGNGIALILASNDLLAGVSAATGKTPAGRLNSLAYQIRCGTAAPEFLNWSTDPSMKAAAAAPAPAKSAIGKLISAVVPFKKGGI